MQQAPPDGVFRMTGLRFLTKLDELEQRTSDVSGLAELARRSVSAVAEYDSAHPNGFGPRVNLWIAIKPSRKVRAWVTGEPDVSADVEDAIGKAIEKLSAPIVRQGLISFVVSIARTEETLSPGELPAVPSAWRRAVRKEEPVEDLILRVWSD